MYTSRHSEKSIPTSTPVMYSMLCTDSQEYAYVYSDTFYRLSCRATTVEETNLQVQKYAPTVIKTHITGRIDKYLVEMYLSQTHILIPEENKIWSRPTYIFVRNSKPMLDIIMVHGVEPTVFKDVPLDDIHTIREWHDAPIFCSSQLQVDMIVNNLQSGMSYEKICDIITESVLETFWETDDEEWTPESNQILG